MRKKKGFSLVEIMVVVGIIALLTAMLIPNFLKHRAHANDTAAQAALKAISTAMEAFASANGTYPTDPNSLLGATPPYLSSDYFTGTHNGFTFSSSLTTGSYSVTATPLGSNQGTASYTISTGSVLVKN